MITLRVSIDDINIIYKSLEVARDEAHTHDMNVDVIQAIMDGIAAAAEKDVTTWDGYVINEVNSLLDVFVPEAETGNVGIRYDKPVLATYESGPVYDDSKATAVTINLVLEFKEVIDIK